MIVLVGYHSAHGRLASVETELGTLQIAEMLVLDGAGLITRHVIGQRGFWGKSLRTFVSSVPDELVEAGGARAGQSDESAVDDLVRHGRLGGERR